MSSACALWLSAPMDNPDDCVLGTSGKTYSAYHAYFPSNTLDTEPRFGTLEELRRSADRARARDSCAGGPGREPRLRDRLRVHRAWSRRMVQ